MRPTPCGCTSALLPEFTGTAVDAATPQLCLRRLVLTNSTSLAPPQAAGLVRSVARPLQIANASLVCNLVPSVLPEKVGKKMRRRRVILRADAREFLAAPRPERPIRAQNCYFPDSFCFRYCLHACRGRCPQKLTIERDILHHRRIRRCAVISTAGCFTIFPAWQRFSMGALSPHRRRCSQVLQRDSRVLAAAFFYGVILWLAVQSDPRPAPLFAHFFWQDRRNQIANQRSVCNLERTSNGTDETCRLRRGEGCGVCEDESPKAQLQCHCKKGISGESGQMGGQRCPPLQIAAQKRLRNNGGASPQNKKHSRPRVKGRERLLRGATPVQRAAPSLSPH